MIVLTYHISCSPPRLQASSFLPLVGVDRDHSENGSPTPSQLATRIVSGPVTSSLAGMSQSHITGPR